MALTSVDLDPKLLERARVLMGEKSHRAVLDRPLRRLSASRQKATMLAGISALSDLESELDATVVAPPHPTS